ncbi:MAG: hypothetical protein GC131_06940 [Alphaproteobacteria bacterium]|nr:hypothetical protein [Alphaproteobacteria bacterium]
MPDPVLAVLKNPLLFALTVLAAMFAMPANAFAQSLSFGEMMCNTFTQMGELPTVIQIICYIGGIFVIALGVQMLRQGAEDGSRSPPHKAILMLIGGGLLLSLPEVVSWAIQSMFGYGAGGAFYCQPGGGTTDGGGDLAAMMVNFIEDIKQPIIAGVAAIAFLLGVFYIARGLFKITRFGQDPRTHSMHIIVSQLVFGTILVVLSQSLGGMLQTIFGQSEVATFAGIDWSSIGVSGDTTRADEAIRAAIIFFQLVGLIAFLRGWVMVKHAVEGVGQQTIGQGLTHVIGGAIAVNIPLFLYAAERTFGVSFVV